MSLGDTTTSASSPRSRRSGWPTPSTARSAPCRAASASAADPDLYLLDEPVTGVDVRTQEDLMDVLEGEARAGKTVIATTHDLICAAQRFHQAVLINGRVIAQGSADLVLDQRLLAETYGGHVLILPGDGERLVLDDAHHHDEAPGERHFHDDKR